MFKFSARQHLPIDIEKAWDFFSSPVNLAVITPPKLDFRIRTRLDNKPIYNGQRIDYTVKPLFGLPLHWQTEITDVKHGVYFTDVQRKGPYKRWEHRHTFTQDEKGVMMQDEVSYELPLGIVGTVAHRLLVRKEIEHIFEYRKHKLIHLFGNAD